MENQPLSVAPNPSNDNGAQFTPPIILPKKKHWIRRILIAFVCIVVVILVAAFNLPRILNIFYHDIAPIDDSDLALQKINLPDIENGYVELSKAIGVMYAPPEMIKVINDLSEGKNWNEATATLLISKNTQAIALFDRAANKPEFQWPVTADPANMKPDTIMSGLNDWRTISRLTNIYAIELSKQGNDLAAIEAALDSVRIGQKIENSQNNLIEYLVGISLKGGGLQTLQKIMSSSRLTSAQMLPYINEMNQYVNNDQGLANAFKAEYHSMTAWLDPEYMVQEFGLQFDSKDMNIPQDQLSGLTPKEYASKTVNSYYFQPNRTKLLFVGYARDFIKNIPGSCGLVLLLPIEHLAPTNAIRMYLEPNAIGEILHDVVLVSLYSVNRVKCEDKARVGETQILMALRGYKNATKSLPSTIDQLVPKYLPTIPTDPFNKQPLQYSLSTKTIFSTYSTSTIPVNF